MNLCRGSDSGGKNLRNRILDICTEQQVEQNISANHFGRWKWRSVIPTCYWKKNVFISPSAGSEDTSARRPLRDSSLKFLSESFPQQSNRWVGPSECESPTLALYQWEPLSPSYTFLVGLPVFMSLCLLCMLLPVFTYFFFRKRKAKDVNANHQ